MQGHAWVNLLRQIPPPLLELLVVVTSTGIEIQVQTVIRVEVDFLAVRGRTTGSTESGMVMVVPFAQISYIGFHRKLTDPEVAGIFDNFTAPAVIPLPAPSAYPADATALSLAALPAVAFAPKASVPSTPPPVQAETPVEASTPAAAPSSVSGVPAAPASGTTAPRQIQPSKSILLARLRARLAQDSSHPPAGAK